MTGAALAVPAPLAGAATRSGGAVPAAGSWQEVAAPAGRPATHLVSVAAAGPDKAWAVGEQGRNGGTLGTPVSLSWNGTAWTANDVSHLTYRGALRGAAAGPGGEAHAIGTDGSDRHQLLTWDGTTWRETAFPGRNEPGTELTDVALAPDGRFWVSGRRGGHVALLYGAGSKWRWSEPLPDTAAPTPTGVQVTPRGEVWVFGDIIARWDGAWTVLPRQLGIRASVTGLLPVAHDDIWLTGFGYGVGGPPGKPPGVTLQHYDGTQWNSLTAPFGVGMLTGIVGDAAGRPDRISGWDFWDDERAHYLRWDGTAWVSERGPTSPTTVVPEAISTIPGAGGGYWSVGTTSSAPFPPAQLHIERYVRA
ncbi:hypothetical protein [Streptomyces sp. NPDC087300]|uniref:hypothetical protein n=1 Tax=Streptomyces sp. NPDC087300 TaxID=3365780 RepID=UPI0037F8CA72